MFQILILYYSCLSAQASRKIKAAFFYIKAFLYPQIVRFGTVIVALESIKAGSKELNNIKLFIIAKSRRIPNIRRPILIRI